MAAEAALFLAYGRKGIVCIGGAYGGTMELLSSQLPELGIPTHYLLGSELGGLKLLLETGAGLVFFETPTNPTLEVLAVRKISGIAHEYGALVAVDSTFASPVNQNPLALGADFVIHSATKYLGGHSDITAGAVTHHTRHRILRRYRNQHMDMVHHKMPFFYPAFLMSSQSPKYLTKIIP
ncbi:protein of unknown function (plasmid) [Acidithiobacillus ferrivorans]|uniref:Cystathionine gamma-synthase n=1 Tax=Acidithiobacillus ferrivorans TaxID=160808 RepID=A0A060UTQ5_9PROT|nr:hypothetical protein AFERRI_580044 [Acidithiobacillus ferrivorans]SMH67833.1 protein of unknown function [Acidithiobacillus ferrivorans]